MRRPIAVFLLCLALTGCMGFWFDREESPQGALEGQGVPQSRAEKIIERGKQHVNRVPFPWNMVALGTLIAGGLVAKRISDKRAKKNG